MNVIPWDNLRYWKGCCASLLSTCRELSSLCVKYPQDGKRDELTDRVTTTQLEALQTFKMRGME